MMPNPSPSEAHAHPTNDVSMSDVREYQTRTRQDQESGDVAFYGSTTQAHVHSPPSPPPQPMVSHADADFEHETTMNMDSVQLRKTLLRIFFKIQPNVQIVVHQDLFMRDRAQGGRRRYYSTFLEDSMLAAATRHSTSPAVRQLGNGYADRAKAQISSELDRPNMASLQGFLVLSDFEATRGRARIGWTYSSKFRPFRCRLAAFLSLVLQTLRLGSW